MSYHVICDKNVRVNRNGRSLDSMAKYAGSVKGLKGKVEEGRSVEFISVASVRHAACTAWMCSRSENSNATFARFLKTSFSL